MPRRSRKFGFNEEYGFRPYVSVANRARQAAAAAVRLKKKGLEVDPVQISGRQISTTFWGKAWCSHLESLSDFASRLPRGRSYVRSGAVIQLALTSGRVSAKVQGSSLYDVEVSVLKLQPKRWANIVAECVGSIDSVVELLRGRLSERVMRAVTNASTGLFPDASEIEMSCSCPDWAGLCKHLAAVLYGVGARFDTRPELLFTLRGVDPSELVAEGTSVSIPDTKVKRTRPVLARDALAGVFGIELANARPIRDDVVPIARTAKRTMQEPLDRARDLDVATRSTRPKPSARTGAVPQKSSGASDLPTLCKLAHDFIVANPGLGVERIAQGLKLSTRELVLPIQKLLDARLISRVGQKRGTKYFPLSLRTPEKRSVRRAASRSRRPS